MRSLREALPHTIRSLGIARRARQAQVLWLWPQVAGPDLSRETAAIKLAGGTLWVSATSAPLAHQLHLERQQLRDRLNAALGAEVVREIRFLQSAAR